MALRWLMAACGTACGSMLMLTPATLASPAVSCAPAAKVQAGAPKPNLPEYSEDEISKMNGKGQKVWVTYRAGVYDVTEFVDSHPGGRNRIMLAAGSSIEPFWKLFTIHDSDDVREILERHRIGNLKGFDAAAASAKLADMDRAAKQMWDNEPKRHPALGVKSAKPFNAETPAEALTGASVVPNELFFVRNHMPVPDLDASNFCLEVTGEAVRHQCLTVHDLKSLFPQHSITTSIQCGGNRRTDSAKTGADVKGLGWTSGAIGTSEWTGVWLRDILNWSAGGKLGACPGCHVRFGGLDKDAASQFEVSVPLDLAMDPARDVLIAYKMNGEAIPRDHGFPLRAIVPGTVGVRNCKWLGSITVHPDESQSDWQQRDYKNFPPWLTGPEKGYNSIYDMPIQSQVTETQRDGNVVTVKGYAYCGGGRGVQRVDISQDGGATFVRAADLSDAGIKQSAGKRWAWYQWSSEFKVPDENAKYTVCSRAVSGTQDVQPRVAAPNFRGLLYNGYSCVDV